MHGVFFFFLKIFDQLRLNFASFGLVITCQLAMLLTINCHRYWDPVLNIIQTRYAAIFLTRPSAIGWIRFVA